MKNYKYMISDHIDIYNKYLHLYSTIYCDICALYSLRRVLEICEMNRNPKFILKTI